MIVKYSDIANTEYIVGLFPTAHHKRQLLSLCAAKLKQGVTDFSEEYTMSWYF